YFHGPAVSSVCIGCWPQDAIQKQEKGNAKDPLAPAGQDVLINPLGLQTPQPLLNQAAKKNVTVLQPELVINNPELKTAKAQYPQHFVNGQAEGVRDAQGKLHAKESMIVEIPPADTSPLVGGDPNIAPPPPAGGLDAIRPVSPSQGNSGPGTGRLKSV